MILSLLATATLAAGLPDAGSSRIEDLTSEPLDVYRAVPIRSGFVAVTYSGSVAVARNKHFDIGGPKIHGPLDPWATPERPVAASPDGSRIVVADRKLGLVSVRGPSKVVRAALHVDVSEVQWCGASFWVVPKGPTPHLFEARVDGEQFSIESFGALDEPVVAIACFERELLVLANGADGYGHLYRLLFGAGRAVKVELIKSSVSPGFRLLSATRDHYVFSDQRNISCYSKKTWQQTTIDSLALSFASRGDAVFWSDGSRVMTSSCRVGERPAVVASAERVESLADGDGLVIWAYPIEGKVVGVAE